MDVLDALSDHATVRHITTRHEQGAAFMADVYGRLTGRAAVAMATLGPGATNLVTGIADAYLDRAPMVAITGQASSDKLHKEAHQVVDIVQMLEPVTKWNTRVERVEAIPEIVRKAFRVATLEKPGPTHIELPENLAAMAVDDDAAPLIARQDLLPGADRRGDRPRRRPHRRLAAAARPRRQRRAAAARARRSCGRSPAASTCPVAVTFMGKGAIDDRSHLSLMAVGLQARDHVLSGFDRADLVICVGYDLVEYAPARWNPDGRKRIVHIDTQPAEVDAAVPARGRADRRHRRLAPAAARRGPAARDQRPRRRRAPRGPRDARPRRPADRAPRGPRGRRRRATGWPITPAAGDRRPARGARPRRHRRSATSAPTRSGSPACTRRTSRTR